MASANRIAASNAATAERERDLAVISEMSREITATLDLDRVMRSAVNLASRVLTFDRGALALYERGGCDIRAVAGADGVDPKSAALQDLAVRAAWAAGRGEHFYLSDRTDPASDAERTFVHVFGPDLERDHATSGLYLPLKDEEGVIGILLFEAVGADFATAHQRKLAEILANQITVAVRNAQLYRQVPMADALGALAARKQALLALPLRRRALYAAIATAVVATMTLIRWPLRVPGTSPVLRPFSRADVRATIAGTIDRVLVREGSSVVQGAPMAHLRDDELRAQRDAAAASIVASERAASIAASRGDAAVERLERTRLDALQRELQVLDEQLRAATLRAPISGVVLSARPEERAGSELDAGGLFAVVGRTDSLELELGVDQVDVTRVHVGDDVRLRVSALPQRTFVGRVSSIAPIADADSIGVHFPVRAVVANDAGLLRPGMAVYARILTDPTSLAGRLLRAPVRAIRLLWWRLWS
jgi:multidrug resistance efflux pump